MRQVVRVCLLAVMMLSVSVAEASVDGVAQAPAMVRHLLPQAFLAGTATMRLLGLRIYDAQLWVDGAFDPARFYLKPLVLELTYHRHFSGAAIAQRSVQEMQRQMSLPPTQYAGYETALRALIPDVRPGDRLSGFHQPGFGLHLWRDDEKLGVIADPQLARLFVGIWLSPETSEPHLRRELLRLWEDT